ncbi:hypothetical protein AM1_A0380 (plasmid) [Acaryochloris marina MBIC11017]|uniref:Uncharacterized protein n=1 Tax=Acaryochloris marina (strain MBIC 11017) TaxID=329726 RepID=A8ZL30_ACAM1|nr:hypothetical protein AM1_A0380 [Acaryochloris marina MBIC11017]
MADYRSLPTKQIRAVAHYLAPPTGANKAGGTLSVTAN